ncbi:hypothetical protein IFM53868_08401 [Aspergillus udagawae]|uniref:Tautomerase cis-CaaD-like domain-containing protein n=1 Tax=Aspergillus udagawae TaxID=91492 RepID=A0ABQ1B8P3_9EURO|nr:hypothetical protein IFM53868_08401 [Aspergillus udagawae]
MLSSAEKSTLAQQITDTYVELGIPAFLVNVVFHENRVGCFYGGGKAPPGAVFFVIDHAARSFPSAEILSPKGIKWEYNIYQHPADNWRVNGMIPHVDRGGIWQEWIEKDTAVPYGQYLKGDDVDDGSLKV